MDSVKINVSRYYALYDGDSREKLLEAYSNEVGVLIFSFDVV